MNVTVLGSIRPSAPRHDLCKWATLNYTPGPERTFVRRAAVSFSGAP
jgi:hypothetical protein